MPRIYNDKLCTNNSNMSGYLQEEIPTTSASSGLLTNGSLAESENCKNQVGPLQFRGGGVTAGTVE